MDRSEAYRHFAAQCLELARIMDTEQDRAILIEMARLWARLAEYASPSTHKEEDVDPV